MLDKIRKYFHAAAVTLEVLMSLAVFAAIALAILSLIPDFQSYMADPSGSDGLMHLLEKILAIVVGLEFISMLCKPDAENVTEVLIFLIARHMIVLETSSMENLLSVIGITILFVIRYFVMQTRGEERPYDMFSSLRQRISGSRARTGSVRQDTPDHAE